jgi:hypothetical protein
MKNHLIALVLGVVTLISGYLLYQHFKPSLISVGSEMTGSVWFLNTSQQIQSALSTWGLRVPSLANCDTIDTNGSGVFTCGSDATGGGGGGGLSTTTPWTNGNLAYVTGLGTVGSVATGTLTETVTGLEFDATRGLVGGAAVLSLSSGYTIPTTTGLSNLYANSHSPVTLSGALDYITLVGQDIVRGAISLVDDITGVLGLANGGTGSNLSDPNADRIMFWDDSAGQTTWLTAGSGLSISGTTMTATGGSASSTASTSLTVCSRSVCDYVTDGAADEVQINQALSAASTTGGIIQLFNETYVIAAPIVLNGETANDTGNPTIQLRGMGIDSTILDAASNVNVIELRKEPKFVIEDMTLRPAGSGYGVYQVAGTERGNWQSEFRNIFIEGDFSTMTASSWGMYLESPFRMRFENIEMNGVVNGIALLSHTEAFNPGNLSIDRMFIDLWDNAVSASSTAFKLAVATSSSTGVNNLVSVNRLDIAGGTNLTNSIGIHILGSISSYGDARHNTFTNLNIEDIKNPIKLERGRDNTFIDINYTRVLSGGTIISLDSNSHNNFFENVYAVAQGASQTFNLITDSNGSSNLPNRLARVDGFQPSSVTINASLAANTILEHIDLSGGSPTIDSDITDRNNRRTFADVLVTDEVYGAGWDSSLEVPTKNALYDKIQTLGGSGAVYLATSSPWTEGNVAYVTGQGTVGSVATGTLTETVSGLELNSTRALIGGSAILALTSGFTIPLTASTTEWSDFFTTPSGRITAGTGIDWSGNTLNGVYTAGDALTLTGEDFDFDGGASPAGELGGTWASPTIDDSLSVTSWNLTTPTLTSFFGTPCSGNQFLQDISDTGAFTCATASGGGGSGSLSTTTDIVGDPATAQEAAYLTTDFMIGGSASTSAEFQFDDDGGKFIISSSSANATGTIESTNITQSMRIGDDSGVGLEYIFSVVGDAIIKAYGAITELIITMAETLFQGNVKVTGTMHVATTTYYGATTTDALTIAGFNNSGEWLQEFCTSPTAEVTQVVADTLRGCGRFAYLEDANGALDFTVPTTGTSTYFRLRPGATGVTTAAGDGMGIGWASGLDFGDIQRQSPAMEWAMRQDAMSAATSTFLIAGITDAISVSANFAAEPAQGFYIIATSTANFQFACNPSTGGTTYIDTGIASSTTTTTSANPFNHFRLEVGGTSNTAVTAILKARTVTNQNMTHIGSCTLDLSASTQAVAPTVAIGKSTAGTSPELHVMFIKFWYRHKVFF